LAEYESRAAHRLRRKSEAVAQQVMALRRQNPAWGKARIAHEVAKANNWVSLVSANTVKRILRDAGLWPEGAQGEKKQRRG